MSYQPSIAIIGTNGLLASHTLKSLKERKENFTLPIRAITRGPAPKSDDFVQYITASTPEEYTSALQGIDVIMALTSGPLDSIAEAVIVAKPKLYIPSQFGIDQLETETVIPGFLQGKTTHSQRVRNAGIKVADVCTALFSVENTFLYNYVAHVGVNVADKTVTYIGDKNKKFNYSKLPDIANSLAVLAAKDPSTIPDVVRIYSGVTSQADVVARFEKRNGYKLTEKPTESFEDAKKHAKHLQDTQDGFDLNNFFYFLHVLTAAGPTGGLNYINKNDREFVNPGESLFKWGDF